MASDAYGRGGRRLLSSTGPASLIVAALGPTNTGKTHRAVERMLEHDSGMIGLPLRLLAREVYDRITARIGEQRVALITGEERRVPPRPSYWVCTTEAMPTDREVDFVAVDEIQLAAHPQRGHVFTDRVLHARGRRETWFMGAETARPMMQRLVPTAEARSHPRFSSLTSAGSLRLGALPPRTAVVAFSTPQVYEMAERLRHRRGGAAVILGALSPRARNAQVALYQSGEVQYMVATDAIGMGLNMNVDLVAFASLTKFDGHQVRTLEPAELAQIAGRAGRHMNDGSFATVAPVPALPDNIAYALENHRFPPLRFVYWRNSDLDLSSLDGLLTSLAQRPPFPWLRRVEQADDESALEQLAQQEDIRRLARGTDAVTTLFEVCRIPDFRQLLLGDHVRLLGSIFEQLMGSGGTLNTDWVANRVARIDDITGDIDTLLMRMAFIRTWTYVANRPGWLNDAKHWRARTSEIEDRLSDALHQRLIQRFVAESKGPRRQPSLPRSIQRHAEAPEPVAVNLDSPFGVLAKLRGSLRDQPVASAPTVQRWVQDVVEAGHGHEQFTVDRRGRITSGPDVVGRMIAGVDLLHPEVVVTLEDLGAGARSLVQRRLLAFARDLVEELLSPLRLTSSELSPDARGLVYQLEQRLGTVRTEQAREQLRRVTKQDRHVLRRMGIRLGRRCCWSVPLLKAHAAASRVALCSAYLSLQGDLRLPGPGATSMPVQPDIDDATYTACGFPVIANLAVRADLLERIDGHLFDLARQGPFPLPSRIARWLGLNASELGPVVEAYGYRGHEDGTFTDKASHRSPGRSQPRRPDHSG